MTATIPSPATVHGGATRREAVDRIKGLGGVDLLRKEIGRHGRYIGRHRKGDPTLATTLVMPRVSLETLEQPSGRDELTAALERLGASVLPVQRDSHGPCEVCQLEGREADCEVYIGKDSHEVMCGPCAIDETEKADQRVVVEVLEP